MTVKGYYYSRLGQEELDKIQNMENEIKEKTNQEVILLAVSKEK